MARQILLLDEKESPWTSVLQEYLEDTSAGLHLVNEPSKAGTLLQSQDFDLLFINTETATLPFIQKIKVFRHKNPAAKVFDISGRAKPPYDFIPDAALNFPDSMLALQKSLTPYFNLPSVIRILSIDDQEEIGRMMEDYFENRVNPSFEFHHTTSGKLGLEILEKKPFDVIVLDIKMPEMDGRMVYREIQKRRLQTPVIIFFDALFDDELTQIYEHGRPAVVEKGSWTSSMPEMMGLIKKMVYFG